MRANGVVLSVADRVDLAVRCTVAGAFRVTSDVFDDAQVDYAGHPAFDEHSMPTNQTLLDLVVEEDATAHRHDTVWDDDDAPARAPAAVDGASAPTGGAADDDESGPAAWALPARPSWMSDLRGAAADARVARRRTVWMAGAPSIRDVSSPYNYTVVGTDNASVAVYDVETPTAFPRVGAIEEWTLARRPPGCATRELDADQCVLNGVTYDTGSSVRRARMDRAARNVAVRLAPSF